MSAFNPWLGFPARNAVYLDRDFDRQRGNGQAAYGTFQTAYDYAAALAVSTGETVLIYVGEGTAAQFGNLVLTAAWDTRVILSGISKALSIVGTITGSSPTGGYSVVMSILNITVGNITTSTTEVAGNTTASGAITILGNGRESCNIGIANTSAPAGGLDSGVVSLSDLTAVGYNTSILSANDSAAIVLTNVTITSSVVNTAAVGNAAALTATNCILPSSITHSTLGGATTGDFDLDRCTAFTFVLISGGGGSQGIFKAKDSSFVRINNSAAQSLQNVKLSKCRIIGSGSNTCISVIENNTVIDSSFMSTAAGNAACIGDAIGTSGVSQIIDTTLIPHGTGVPIAAAVAATILVDSLRVKKDVDPTLVTLIGSYTVNGNYASPF